VVAVSEPLPLAPKTLRQGRIFETLLPGAGVIIGGILIVGPFLATVIRSLLTWGPDGASLSLDNFALLLSDARFYAAVGNTIICGGATTILSCVLGLTLAWIVARTDLPGRSWFETLNLVPFFLSPYVGALSWIFLIAPHSGLLQTTLKDYLGVSADFLNIYSLGGVIWVLTLFYTPYIYLFVIGPMRQMDGALEDAARVNGASFWTTVRHITIPLLAPALLSGALIVFVTSAGLFDVPLALASPVSIRTVPTEIFALVQYPSDLGPASSLGVVILLVTVALTLLQRRYLARRRYDIVSGKGYRPRLVELRGRGRLAAYLVEACYIGCGVVLPVIALLLVSLSAIWTGRFRTRAATLDNYDFVLFGYKMTQQAILNSLALALAAASITVVLGVLQSYYLHRGRSARRSFADIVVSLPLGIPGIILALGFLLLAIRTPLYSTLWIILIAYVARFFPFGTRTISAMLVSINPELEHSARASGANWLQTLWFVLLPLLRPAIIAAWLMMFVICIRELGATILLYAQGTETISVALVVLNDRSAVYVAALAVIQLVLLLIAFTLFKVTRISVQA
jgi:iron(III) transport system permease protein